MTIDSSYLPVTKQVDFTADPNYIFEFESIGGNSVYPLAKYTYSNGDVAYMDVLDYTTEYGGNEPIYYRGEFIVTGPTVLPQDAVSIEMYIERNTPITQELDLIPYTPAPMESVEFSIDKLTLILQEIDGEKCPCPWGGTVDNPYVPPTPPHPDYSCSSLLDEETSQGFDITQPVISDDINYPWPFGTVSQGSQLGSADNLSFWNSFVNAPAMSTDWGNTLTLSDMTTWPWYDDAIKFLPCGVVEENIAVCVDVQGDGSYPATTGPIDGWSPAASGSSSTMVFTGYQGGDNAYMDMNRIPAARWNVIGFDDLSMGVLQQTVNANIRRRDEFNHYIEIKVFDNTISYPSNEKTVTLDIGPIEGQWWLWSYSEICRYELVGNSFRNIIDVTVRVESQNGDSYTLTNTGTRISNFSYGIKDAQLLTGTTMYHGPEILVAPSAAYLISLAYIGFGGPGDADHDLIATAFRRNFTDYTP